MRTRIIFSLLLSANCTFLFANYILPVSISIPVAINDFEVRLNMKIVGAENIGANMFTYDIVGLESDASATYLTSGVTEDVYNLVTDLKWSASFVKIGIKLKWGDQAKYFLLDRIELSYGYIDWNEGRE